MKHLPLQTLSNPILTIAFLTLFSFASDLLAQLDGTKPLKMQGDIAAQLVDGVDKFLLREIDKSVERRARHWKRDFSSPEAYDKSIEPNRKRLAHILGVRDERIKFDGLEFVSTTSQSQVVGKGDNYKIFAVRWPVLRNMHGEGLLLVPDETTVADVIAIPDADQTPEMLCGLSEGVSYDSQFARRLAESNCRVLVPTLISREVKARNGRAKMTNREYLYRSAYELGRHLIGYEVQKVLAGIDWFEREANGKDPKIGVVGYGEGGMLALYAGALDTRIDATCVAGYFGPRETIWQEPLSRNVFGLLEQFGDAELALMTTPRALLVQDSVAPAVNLPSQGGAPGVISTADRKSVHAERNRVDAILTEDGKAKAHPFSLFGLTNAPLTSMELVDGGMLGMLVETLEPALTKKRQASRTNDSPVPPPSIANGGRVERLNDGVNVATRQERQVREIDEHNQWLLSESQYIRRDFMNISLTSYDKQDGSNKLDNLSPEAYEKSVERFREYFRHEVVGHFDHDLLPFDARSRKAYDEEKWTGYEVVLDVFPDVIAYGILCLPKDLKPDDKRPVVVCQHGLEGRPQDIVTGDHGAYHDFASKLAERGFITFAPQNLYIGKDRFRTLQRKAYTLKKTLFSIIVPQHQQIVNWLKTHPNVDGERIAFYGLSYGGKSAMRIPPLVTDYCLSICSADFNEWVCKNASTRSRYSYVWTGEYEIFEFDLGSTFNYAEMAALIAPRPFMVERGHFDGVGSDEEVAYEFAKVRHLYAARLNLPDRCEIEWFVGPHTINGNGTFDFLHTHLAWPKPTN